MPFQKLYNSKHLQVFSANNEVLTPADPEHLSRSFVFRAESPNMLVTINIV